MVADRKSETSQLELFPDKAAHHGNGVGNTAQRGRQHGARVAATSSEMQHSRVQPHLPFPLPPLAPDE